MFYHSKNVTKGINDRSSDAQRDEEGPVSLYCLNGFTVEAKGLYFKELFKLEFFYVHKNLCVRLMSFIKDIITSTNKFS
jgi:hypothetical protein